MQSASGGFDDDTRQLFDREADGGVFVAEEEFVADGGEVGFVGGG